MEYTFIENTVEPVVAELLNSNVFSFDLETTGLNPIDSRILLAQLGFENGHNYVINIQNANFAKLLPWLENRTHTVIIHNAKFEQKFIQDKYKVAINGVFDTMLAEQIISGLKFAQSLKLLAEKYTGEKLDKDVRSSFVDMPSVEMFTPEQLEYAAKDVEILFPIWELQKDALVASDQEKIAQLEFDLTAVVAAMELEGIPINTKKWRAKLEEYKQKLEQQNLDILKVVYDGDIYDAQEGMFEQPLKKFNPGSAKQVAKVLTEKFSLELPQSDKGNDKTDERTLQTLHHPFANQVLEWRKTEKVINTYGESFLSHIHPFTGRIHSDYNQIGTDTGRFASREPNFQNVPADFRQCIGNLNDHKIVGADYANIELRIIAELSDDENLIRAFKTGDDPHKSTASIMFNIPIEEVTKEQRFIAKTINFGLTYGMGAPKLRDILNEGKDKKDQLSLPTVYKIVNTYKDTYRGVTEYFARSGADAFNKGESSTMLGRKRYFERPSGVNEEVYKKLSASIRRQGGNAPIQGTNADITKLAMVNLYEDLSRYQYRAKIINQVHDEIVVLAHNSQAESIKEIVHDSMMYSAQQVLTKVPVKVDTYVADVWAK